MDYDTLKHRFEWFKQEASRLEEIAEDLDCEQKKVEGIQLQMTNAYFRGLQTQYDEVYTALTDGAGSLGEGGSLIGHYAAAIRRTGRDYLATEAENEEVATKIVKLMDEESF